MSIGPNISSTGMSVRSPSNAKKNMEDVELGSSSHGRRLKMKDSDVEMAPLIVGNGDGSTKAPLSPMQQSSEGERSHFMKSFIASAMYSGCSVGMVLVNKSLASRFVWL